MRKQTKKVLSFVLSAAMAITVFSIPVTKDADAADEATDSSVATGGSVTSESAVTPEATEKPEGYLATIIYSNTSWSSSHWNPGDAGG